MNIKFLGQITIFLSLLLLISASLSSKKNEISFDKDAGYIPSFTEFAKVTTSSTSKNANLIIDKNYNTSWQSDAPLPTGFISNAHQNIFLKTGNQFFKSGDISNFSKVVDGDLSSSVLVNNSIKTNFPEPKYLHSISLKLAVSESVEIIFQNKNQQEVFRKEIDENSNYQLQRIGVEQIVASILIKSNKSFTVFEIAALEDLPKEFAIFDFQQKVPIGQIHTKHWAGENSAKSTQVFISNDKRTWEKIGDLNPNSVHPFILNLKENREARYLKIEHELFAKDWNKCFLWEVKVYDKNGIYGEKPIAQQSAVTLAEMLGVNGYWGWGHKNYSPLLKKGEGVDLYAPIVSHFRNYHDMTWDILKPDQKMDFQKMAKNQGTPAKDWVNWDREYKTWLRHGQNIQASLQFFRFKDSDWKKPYESAFDYASKFVRHYGATHGNGLVCSIEAGNEPWEYDAEIYKSILFGMAKGAKTTDPTIEFFPCALQAVDPEAEISGPYKNYIGARVTEAVLPYLDGINVHAYSYVNDFFGRRKAVFPEHQNSTFWEVLNAIRWRDANLPGKKIYLSEWGYDSDGGGENCVHSECVGEEAAAVYGIRNLLIASRLGVDRATWFFYANTEVPSSLYMRSGLTGSKKTGFKKKKVFYAFENLLAEIGDKYFLDIYQEDENIWGYYFGNPNGEKTHLIIWKPIDYNDSSKTKFKFKTSRRTTKISSILNPESEMNFKKIGKNQYEFLVGSTPLILEL